MPSTAALILSQNWCVYPTQLHYDSYDNHVHPLCHHLSNLLVVNLRLIHHDGTLWIESAQSDCVYQNSDKL